MANDANIERITFEEIQEFKNLDLYNLPPAANPDDLTLLVYDATARTFKHALLEAASGGNIIINTDAALTRSITVNTDDLSVARGYVFLKDTTFTDVLDTLCNPPVISTLTASISPNLIEVGASTGRALTYNFTEGDDTEDLDPGTVKYFREAIELGSNVDSFPIAIEGTVTYYVNLSTLSVALPEKLFSSSVTMRAIYPAFIGSGVVVAGTPLLEDIKVTASMVCDFPALAAGGAIYWFAVHTSNTPLTWAELSSAGDEDPINRGELSTLFELTATIGYNGNNYSVYSTISTKDFPLRIKIKF